MEMDYQKRATGGDVTCIRVEGDKLRLIFDDVASETEENPTSWDFGTNYTWNTYETEKVLESRLTDEQYQEIGFNLMARLGAIYKTKQRIMPED
jgi:hypothetical protein